jgi:aromatic-L-amino-acid decarboxylase
VAAQTHPNVEETLDPADWASLRVLAHRMVDDMLDYTAALREQPAWQHMPDEAKARFHRPLPLDPEPTEEVYEEFLQYVLPYATGNVHPRFWGWVIGTGTAYGALAEFLAAIMNPNAGGLDHSAVHVERQVIDWLKEMLGYPSTASGVLTSGCSAANLIGLAVARNAKAKFDLRREGLCGAPRAMVLYASQEAHSSVQKAVELLGMGSNALHLIPVDDAFQINLDALKAAITQDRRAGQLPFCVVGAAGTTNTGAIDDLETLAEICNEEDLWLHVDGAFGAWAALSPEAWSAPTRWPLTCTSGCICHTRSAACSSATSRPIARPFR